MCGIICGIAQRDVAPILLEGLRRLEYRGYDSAGIAVIDHDNKLHRVRTLGKVCELTDTVNKNPLSGGIGIAHTRWATHGMPSETNAHPHMSGDHIALVHNGIIENHDELRAELKQQGYTFDSETDTEIIVHLLDHELKAEKNIVRAIQVIANKLEGAFALGLIHRDEPQRLFAVRRGSPLVIGVGIGEHFIASDCLALLPVTRRFVQLEEGDVAEITRDNFKLFNSAGEPVERQIQITEIDHSSADRGQYRHYMLKEIFEQPESVRSTLQGRINNDDVILKTFGNQADGVLKRIKRVQIVACGTSYHAGLVGRYWLEALAGVPCQVEIASEIRYRKAVVDPGTLFVAISQSGETADTLAALRDAKANEYEACLAICNVPQSSLVRESDLCLMTAAGVEIGVASTKAFTTQLTALLMLVVALGRYHKLESDTKSEIIAQLNRLPQRLEQVLLLDDQIKQLAKRFSEKTNALFLGRGIHCPIAYEGALKLKEISYIHAEAYPAGELKHGTLALVDKHMPVIALAPNDKLAPKLKANLAEVRARAGEVFVFADPKAGIEPEEGVTIIPMPAAEEYISPIVYTIPLQLLAYHVAVIKGTDVDQPRNLAKSVTVE